MRGLFLVIPLGPAVIAALIAIINHHVAEARKREATKEVERGDNP